MLSLTGTPLFALTLVLAALGPIGVVWWWRRSSGRIWFSTVRRWASVVLCQLLAVTALFLWVNNQYGFYTSWSDLAGRSGATAKIRANGLVSSGAGRAEVLTVAGAATGHPSRQMLVWLPPQYDQTSYAQSTFPVVLVLPGQPSTPEAMYRHFNFGAVAAAEIAAGRTKPFVAVFPPLMTNPPRDTECTNIAGGPQAETWLSRDIPRAVGKTLRTAPTPWASIGWSTGAFCSAKLLLKHPTQYQAAVGLGGYYQPITDKTTGDLFGSSATARQQNSPV
jgi:S-formylglutathione hydrolase FrmB